MLGRRISSATDAESPAIWFLLLPLSGLGADSSEEMRPEDLYIKMNSRGKPLTEFENFKAHFEQDICLSARADEFAHRIDGPWADLMWPIHGGDNIVDDELIRFIDYITEICELRDGSLEVGGLGERARAVFGPNNPNSGDHIEFLFRAFDVFADGQRDRPSFVRETFESVFSLELPDSPGYDPETAVLFGSSSVNLFEQCCHAFDSQRYGRREFTLQDSLLLYAVLLHLTEETEDFDRRSRILRNLLAASVADEIRRPNMPGLIKDVEAVIIHGDLDSVSKLSSNQVQNERAKVAFLAAHPNLSRAVFRLEDHPLLRGTLSAFEFTAGSFERRAGAFELAFADPERYLDLTGALLATGDYQRRRPRTQSWQFGTAERKNQAVWRYLLTEASSDDLLATRAVLARFLDDLATSTGDIRGHLKDVAAACLAEREERAYLDWRYYLIKYPAMRGSRGDRQEGKTGIYWGVDGELGYSLCMLRTYQLNGYYRDPILLEVWRSSGVGDRVLDPWFSGYVTDSRWLRLVRSQVGLRCVSQGFELQGPGDEDLQRHFLRVCRERGVVTAEDGRLLLRVPQDDAGDGPIDCVDRVVMGAAFVKELVEAGL